ncbi:DinB family protein [Treponema sp. R6D11]
MLTDSIRNQTKQIFQNIEILFEVIPANEFDTEKGGFKTWKHFYHLIHSLDKNFIDPGNYVEPEFHKKNLNIIYINDENKLTKDEISNYYENVKNKIQKYLNDLKDETLENKVVFNGMEFTKIELILAQLRHIFYHIGYLHCCIKIEKGETPEYIGLYKAVPEK